MRELIARGGEDEAEASSAFVRFDGVWLNSPESSGPPDKVPLAAEAAILIFLYSSAQGAAGVPQPYQRQLPGNLQTLHPVDVNIG